MKRIYAALISFIAAATVVVLSFNIGAKVAEAEAPAIGHPYRALFVPVPIAADASSPQVPAPMVDPLQDPGGAVGLFSKLYHLGAWIPLIILGAFCILYVAVKEDSWFREGKRAAYFAAVLGFLGMLVGPASQGTTPNLDMVLMALASAVGLLLPNVLPKPAAKP